MKRVLAYSKTFAEHARCQVLGTTPRRSPSSLWAYKIVTRHRILKESILRTQSFYEIACWCWEAFGSRPGRVLQVKLMVASAVDLGCNNLRMGQKRQKKCPVLAGTSVGILAPTWMSETSYLRAAEKGASHELVFVAVAVALSTRRCPIHVLTVSSKKLLVAARQGMSAV